MLGWLFGYSCPCDPAAKKWTEDRLLWLTRQFGLHILLERPVILPTEAFFPDSWEPTPKGTRPLFRRVCEYMGVDKDCVELRFTKDDHTFDPSSGFAAGTWNSGIIRLNIGCLDRPADLIGIMAHELAHQRLLGENRINPEVYDNELLTDLTAVYHGFGVFLANNPRKSTGELSHWPGTSLFRPEYLSEPMLGYALAHIAWFRDEPRPAWAQHLRWAPRAVFKEGLTFLQKTGDSSFKPIRLNG